jgi:hypothetical protein
LIFISPPERSIFPEWPFWDTGWERAYTRSAGLQAGFSLESVRGPSDSPGSSGGNYRFQI